MKKSKVLYFLLIAAVACAAAYYLLSLFESSAKPDGKITMSVVNIYDINADRSILGITFKNETDEWITFGNASSSISNPYQWMKQLFGRKIYTLPSSFNGYCKTDSPPGWSGTLLGGTENRYPLRILHTIKPHSSITVYTEIYSFGSVLKSNNVVAITYGFTYFKHGHKVNDSGYHMIVSEPIPDEILQRYSASAPDKYLPASTQCTRHADFPFS